LTCACFEGARNLLTRLRCSKKTESDKKKADSKPDAAAKKAGEGEKA
jgi:hypothetical protein